MFLYAWLGLTLSIVSVHRIGALAQKLKSLPQVLLQCLGAAVAAAAPSVSSWSDPYASDDVGGLLAAMLGPVGGFGKFLLVVLSLSVTANLAPTLYSICFAMQTFIPPLVHLPRYIFSVFAIAMCVSLFSVYLKLLMANVTGHPVSFPSRSLDNTASTLHSPTSPG